MAERLQTLADWLAGEFENAAQARSQSAWFVHLYLWHRPLPVPLWGNRAIFAEQAPIVKRDRPYRQRVMMLQSGDGGLQVQFLAFKRPEAFLGAGEDGEKLRHLSPEDLEILPGCVLAVQEAGDKFIAQPRAGDRCCFQAGGEWRQVELGFEVNSSHFWSRDRGIDPETGRGIWGALLGPYEFVKCRDLATEFP